MAGGGGGFWHGLFSVGFGVDPLALEVVEFDVVAIDEAEEADAGPCKRGGLKAAERSAANYSGSRGTEAFLAFDSNGRKAQLP